MITHTVLFRLARPLRDGDHDALLAGLRAFAADPPHATGPGEVRDSLGLRGDSPRTADAMLVVTFPAAEVFDDYIAHPRHQALVTDVLERHCEGWWSVQHES